MVTDGPFELVLRVPELELGVLPPDDRDEELRLRDDADAVRRLAALVLFGRLRELDDRALDDLLLDDPPLPLVDPLLFELEPFELRDDCFRLLVERVLAWAIAPP